MYVLYKTDCAMSLREPISLEDVWIYRRKTNTHVYTRNYGRRVLVDIIARIQ